MDEIIGCWVVADFAVVAWLLVEMYIADLGPTYDENYQPL